MKLTNRGTAMMAKEDTSDNLGTNDNPLEDKK
jgi:hypothetical protein